MSSGEKKSNGHDKGDDEKVVSISTLAERDRQRRKQEQKDPASLPKEPLFSIPPATKYLLAILVSISLVLFLFFPPSLTNWIIWNLGFIPGRFVESVPYEWWTPATIITHMFLHGSWLHLIMNSVMLLAFGAGVEKWIGSKKMFFFFIICGIFGVAAHFVLNPYSVYPVVGASGALSGFFAAALIMINRGKEEMGGQYGLLPFIILWIGITIAFGMMGSPDGSPVAWAAHIGGFLGGFAALKLLRI